MTAARAVDDSGREGGRPSPLAALREEAAARFRESLPDSRDEHWRYTAPSLFAPPASLSRHVAASSAGDARPLVVTVDAGDAPGGASEGVTAVWEDRFSPDDEATAARMLCRPADVARGGPSGFAAIAPLAAGAPVLLLRLSGHVPGIVRVDHVLPAKETNGVAAAVLVVVAEPGSRAVVVSTVPSGPGSSGPSGSGRHYVRVEAEAMKGSSLVFATVQSASDTATVLSDERVVVRRDAKVTWSSAAAGARAARTELAAVMAEPGATADLRFAVVGDGDRHVDVRAEQIHVAPDCRSELLCKNVVTGRAKGVYVGRITVAEGARGTDAYQTNRNLILSPAASVESVPNLEIRANDVRCSHGSSTGRIGDEELFYLRSRGLTAESAERLLVRAFLEEVGAGAGAPAVAAAFAGVLEARLGAPDRSS